jgi:hypothetical protein
MLSRFILNEFSLASFVRFWFLTIVVVVAITVVGVLVDSIDRVVWHVWWLVFNVWWVEHILWVYWRLLRQMQYKRDGCERDGKGSGKY